jgi:TRAP-type C4-dicarboxylate transport system permease small subunit
VSGVVRALVGVARALAVLLLATLVIVLLLAIAVRELGIFGGAIPWAEEAERFLFIWLVFVGSPVALDRGEHILIDTLVRLLAAGLDLVSRTGNQTAAALGIPMSLVHAALPLGSALMALQVLLLLARDLRALGRRETAPAGWKAGAGA